MWFGAERTIDASTSMSSSSSSSQSVHSLVLFYNANALIFSKLNKSAWMKSRIESWSIFVLVRVRSGNCSRCVRKSSGKRKTNKSKNETERSQEKRIPCRKYLANERRKKHTWSGSVEKEKVAEMMNPTTITNGGSLEDCHTNFFALVSSSHNFVVDRVRVIVVHPFRSRFSLDSASCEAFGFQYDVDTENCPKCFECILVFFFSGSVPPARSVYSLARSLPVIESSRKCLCEKIK